MKSIQLINEIKKGTLDEILCMLYGRENVSAARE